MKEHKKVSPWVWIPSLYFFEGLPYFIVNTISILIFKDLGMDNGKVALLTSLIGLPWLVKPLWSPFVDILRTKRWWILAMELLIVALFAGLTATLPAQESGLVSAFTVTLVLFWITAFASATHDIAADGFYMLQFEAVGDFDAAQRRKAQLSASTGYSIQVVFDPPFYKLRGGGWTKRKVAEDKARELSAYNINAFVVKLR